jgi:site-specific recombinase XerD
MAKYYKKEDLQFLLPEEVKKLMDSIVNVRDLALFNLMFYHGLRVSEVQRLTIDDVNFEEDTIYVKASKRGNEGREYLNPIEKYRIYAYLLKRPNFACREIFVSQKGNKLSTSQIFRLYQNYAVNINLHPQKQHPHALRHSLAVQYARNGVTAEKVQAMLRHKTIQNTMKYYKILEDQRLAIQKAEFLKLA